jgi:thioredoxin reductase
MPDCNVAIVGAGPYGLSAAAHLRAVRQTEVQVFGETMSFWERNMPKGMLLRSPWQGSHISDPERAFSLDAYRLTGDWLASPVPLDGFVRYGRWFQQRAVGDIDRRTVTRVEQSGGGFQLRLEDGEVWKARRVVVAAGIASFAWRPSAFGGLPSALVSHASDHTAFDAFAGRKVLVVGAGQSALESAALLHESGAEAEVVVRTPAIRWLHRHSWMHTCKPVARLLYAEPDVGQAGVSHLIAHPGLYRRFPRAVQDRLGVRAIRPAGAAWLKPRVDGLPIVTGTTVVSVVPRGGKLLAKLSDGSERSVDHVLLGTGYRIDVARYSFLPEALLNAVRKCGGYPCLDRGFESSVPGLHFVGAPAAWSFGPLTRFVAGTEFVSRSLARRIVDKAGWRK